MNDENDEQDEEGAARQWQGRQQQPGQHEERIEHASPVAAADHADMDRALIERTAVEIGNSGGKDHAEERQQANDENENGEDDIDPPGEVWSVRHIRPFPLRRRQTRRWMARAANQPSSAMPPSAKGLNISQPRTPQLAMSSVRVIGAPPGPGPAKTRAITEDKVKTDRKSTRLNSSHV